MLCYFRGELLQENFSGKNGRNIFPGNFRETFPGKSFLPFCGNTDNHPLGETWRVHYTLRVHNTRLESVFIEKHNILLHETPYEIFSTGSLPRFPKFSGGNFLDGKFVSFPEILPVKYMYTNTIWLHLSNIIRCTHATWGTTNYNVPTPDRIQCRFYSPCMLFCCCT